MRSDTNKDAQNWSNIGAWWAGVAALIRSSKMGTAIALAVACLFRPTDNVTVWVDMVTRRIPDATPVLIAESETHGATLRRNYPGMVVKVAQFKPCDRPAWALCPGTGTTHGVGYRNMCRLWYADMWQLFDRFDAVVRVDSDITILRTGSIATATAASPAVVGADKAIVTEGMHVLFGANKPSTANPYSNVMVVNLTWARTDAGLHRWFDIVKATNCICHNRWGDLPLWGETMRAMGLPVVALPGWRYSHRSHHNVVVS